VRRIKTMALTAVGVCALSAAVVSSASAQQFHASKTGTLKGVQLNTQVFNTGSGAGSVECKKAATSGRVTSLLALSQLVIVVYSECKAFSFVNATITPAHYLFSADNGLVKLDNTITITPEGAGCHVTVHPQDLKEVKFVNSGGKLIEESNVKNIASLSTGGLCGGNSAIGTYVGNNDIELEGGTLSWS
jgi:hypothetical protein